MTAVRQFGLLGPLTVRCRGVVLPVAPGHQRAVLAALLLGAGRVVPVGELTEVLWGSAPPVSARVSVQNYVRRLRRALEAAGPDLISTQPGGYLITPAAGELDVTRFETLVRSARAAARAGSWADAAGRARAALTLWRGEPLADIGSDLLVLREVPRLSELRLQALEARIEADLQLGRPAEVAAELQGLTASHPLRERLYALLMLALYRDGRQGEALAAYRQARRVLAEELGAEPGTGLRELHQRMLAADPSLTPPAAAAADPAPAPGPDSRPDPDAVPAPVPAPEAGRSRAAGALAGAVPVPRQLPGSVPHFAGRAAELAELTRRLDQAGERAPETVVISAIGGTAGVGKTALAVRWAHEVADRFPDGQLYVNLRGYDPDQPVTAADALAGFLNALGVAGPDLPPGAEERAARLRSLLAGRRMLIVLDNAREVEQVRLLLPGAPGCVVVVTSRDSLAGLVARHGAARLDLDLLPQADAVGLLRTLIGARAAADPDAAAVLAGRCARLPLALRVAAELAAARPDAPLAELVTELAGQQRLDLLDAGGDPHTAVRAVFSWSCRHLDADAARAFRLLGLHPGPDLDAYAAAALTGTTAEDASRLLGQLVRAHLIQAAGPGRYSMHDLLREYASEQAGTVEQAGPAEMTRLLDYYLHAAGAAMDTLYPAERHLRPARIPPVRPAAPAPVVAAPPMSSPAGAQAWLDAERPVLVTMTAKAAARGWPGHATALAATICRYLDIGAHYPDAVTVHGHARRAARQVGDRAAEGAALTSLGVAAWRQGRYEHAAGQHRLAVAVCRAAGDRAGEARALGNLGLVDYGMGRYQQAAADHRQALVLYRAIGDRHGEANARCNLGTVDYRLGDDQQALGHHRAALDGFRAVGDQMGETRALTNLGAALERLGQYDQAVGYLQRVLVLCRASGDRVVAGNALANLGVIEERLGRYDEAAGHHQEALELFRQIGDRAGEAEARNGLGETLLAAERPDQARDQLAAALDLAREVGDGWQEGRACDGLARAAHAAGDVAQARRRWQQALASYQDVGAPEAGAVRGRLAALAERREHPRRRPAGGASPGSLSPAGIPWVDGRH